MFKQKRKKFTATVTLEKTCLEKTLVQLTEDQLKAIAGGRMKEDDDPVSGDAT